MHFFAGSGDQSWRSISSALFSINFSYSKREDFLFSGETLEGIKKGKEIWKKKSLQLPWLKM